MIDGIDLVFIYVENLERAVRFYGEKLGLKLTYRSDVWAEFFEGGRTKLALWKNENHSPYDTHIFLATDDITRAFNRLRDSGVEVTFGPQHYFYGDVIEFLDSEGNKLGLYKREREK